MANLLKVYTGSPTAGGTNGTEVSEEHALTAPITASLIVSASAGASAAIKCAARCTSGYQTTGDVALSFKVFADSSAYTGGKYKFAADNGYAEAATRGSRTYTVAGIVSGDVVMIKVYGSTGPSYTAGTDFNVGADDAATAANLAAVINTGLAGSFTGTSSGNVITVAEATAGSGSTPGEMTITGTGTVTNGTAVTSVPDALTFATWVDTLTISDVIGATNIIFWVKMIADAGDTPVKDTTVVVHHEETVEAVA